jgi:predicted RNA-binding protein with PIN domain
LYWVDAYNLLFRLTKDYHIMRQQERSILLAINEIAARRNLPITLVFDGKHVNPSEAIRGNLADLTVIYTPKKQTADDYILQEVRGSPEETVVSSDRELTGKARQRGCKILTIETFMAFLFKDRKRKNSSEKKKTHDTSANIERLRKTFEERFREPES